LHWYFKLKQPDDTTRDPISGEFFATEAIRNSAEALVREGVQNSLDARPVGGVALVRILVSGEEWAAPAPAAARFFGGLRPHLAARGNGIRDDLRPELGHPVRFLAYEDFGTTGLIGDPLQWHRIDGTQNGFFAFFRAEGENAKSDEGRRGRWGVGKFVFPRASMGSAFVAWTVRATDARSLLLGRCILKSHETAEGIHVPDGYFGERRAVVGGQITAPSEDAVLSSEFRETFRLKRTTEPGLSLVVPWYDGGISRGTIVDAAIRDWFYCLLSGELEIEVVDPSGTLRLDRESVLTEVGRLPDRDRDELVPLLDLTRFAISDAARSPVQCADPDQRNSPKWHERMLDEAGITRLRTTLDSGGSVAIRVPIVVKQKGAPDAPSEFLVFLVRDADFESGRPVFVREGIIVSDAKGTSARGYRSLVVATDKPLADLLGDAENPSHTEWRQDTANFKEKYKYGKAFLDFVRASVRNIVKQIEQNAEDVSPDLLVDFFSLPEIEAQLTTRRPAQKPNGPGDQPEPPITPPPARPRRYSLTKVKGGFSLSRGPATASTPGAIEVTVAYDVRNGDPFRKYHTDDFQLLRGGIDPGPNYRGLEVDSYSANTIRWRVTHPDFHVSIAGFDTNRDLVVRVDPEGELTDATAV
jgi:hypothetical protein